MNKTNLQFTRLKEQKNRKKQAEAVLAKTRELLKTEQQNLAKQELTLKKEYEDVLRLEGNSLTSIFHSFLGNKVEKLDKERQEYLAAKFKYEGYKDTVSRLEEEISKQENELHIIGNPETEYAELIKTKSEELKAQNDSQFIATSQKMDSSYTITIEIEEAIAAGEKANQGLLKAIRSMSKAKGWGTFDMLGGGIIATAVKHSHIDNAKAEIQNIQFLLKRFNRELQDIRSIQNANFNPEISGFNKFADFFFDNIIFDWVVQSRIHKSMDNLIKTQKQVKSILYTLKEESASSKTHYKSLKIELNEYLEEA
ncbi:MAG: hypothetical protein HQ541_21095 [Mariniphaga sp.]|nr:hypothetical protein [Mariniphaga sp.]